MPSRLAGDWLTAYLAYTQHHESPESYHLWSGLALLSAAVKRRVYLQLDYGTIYPNLYVIMVASSAKTRKSAAMNFGQRLLVKAFPDFRVMQDSMTSQGLIKELNRKTTVIRGNRMVEEVQSHVAIFADEVANLFGFDKARASQMVIFLTRTYECPDTYDHTTVRDSKVRLYNLYPTLVGGTDPTNLKVLPPDVVGGLIGRLIWVIEHERRHSNSGWIRDPRKALEREYLEECLLADLLQIADLEGEMEASPDAQHLFDTWYHAMETRKSPDPASDAFFHRCHDTARRVAMLLALSESSSLVLEKHHMQRGIELIESRLPETKRVMSWTGGSNFEQGRTKFLDYMVKSGGACIKRKALRYMGMPNQEFDQFLQTMVADGTLVDTGRKVGSEWVLQLTPDANLAKQEG